MASVGVLTWFFAALMAFVDVLMTFVTALISFDAVLMTFVAAFVDMRCCESRAVCDRSPVSSARGAGTGRRG